MFTNQQEEYVAEMFKRLKPVKAVSDELIRSGVPWQSELDRAITGIQTAYDCLEKLVGREKN